MNGRREDAAGLGAPGGRRRFLLSLLTGPPRGPDLRRRQRKAGENREVPAAALAARPEAEGRSRAGGGRAGAAPCALRGAAAETRAWAFPRPGRQRPPLPPPPTLLQQAVFFFFAPLILFFFFRFLAVPEAACLRETSGAVGTASGPRPWLATSLPARTSMPRSRSTCKPTRMCWRDTKVGRPAGAGRRCGLLPREGAGGGAAGRPHRALLLWGERR